MKKPSATNTKQLRLSKATVRTLCVNQLQAVAGGATDTCEPGPVTNKVTDTCYDG